ncbi:cytochrome c oxidase subunit I [Hyphomicrobium sp.]|uniref:cytochrome c oxidase subunit I n=1 Tax=Hyphomicrobium sp. TaxID=82 RepID=UPI002D76D186|nr:cbb3-type cytochrome c oxidase subunit I [Hyphomicrobium sp.]HET6390034.1 cbb3-type cytochrome c oxidase subunit I [Hyphomicrobium sp.]
MTIPAVQETPELRARLDRIWETPKGFAGWLSSVDHKSIGIRYIVTAFALLVIGGIEALIMRLQLARPNQQILTPAQYNELFTMHGISMIFWYASPILSGFSNYLWPLILGSRDMAFPRLNALSYWIYLFSGVFLYAAFAIGIAPNAGWFDYVPYANQQYNPGQGIDVYAMALILLGISTTVGAINFVVTLMRTRAAGMSINRMPILVWGTLTASAGNILAVPAVSLAFFLLWLDRRFGTHFYDVPAGGQPLLWQHLFWMFGHPWVYAIVLPAMGMVSDGLPTFCRRPLVGYTLVALATVLTMVIGFGVWVHHMFATGLPDIGMSFFSAASFVIVIPSAVAVFAWTATIALGRPQLTTAFLFFASTIVLFVIGGVSGFMTASVPADWQFTDTYFIVAHIHYVLIGINVFPVLGALYYWFPKMSGRMLSERLGQWNFWLMFIGFNLAFLPMHLTGLWGMPRRVYTYGADFGWNTLNMITTIGSFVLALGVLLLIVNVVMSLFRGAAAGPNPWDAATLECATPSPPPPYNFAVLPTVASRHPLWEDRLQESDERSRITVGPALDNGREALATSPIDAQPDAILKMPEDSYAPLVLGLALSALFVSMLAMSLPGVLCSFAVGLIAMLIWLWPAGLSFRPLRTTDG